MVHDGVVVGCRSNQPMVCKATLPEQSPVKVKKHVAFLAKMAKAAVGQSQQGWISGLQLEGLLLGTLHLSAINLPRQG